MWLPLQTPDWHEEGQTWAVEAPSLPQHPCTPPITQHAHCPEVGAPTTPKAKYPGAGLLKEGVTFRARHTHKPPPPGGCHSPGNGSAGPASSAGTCAAAHSAALRASGPGPRRAAARSPPSHSCPSRPVRRRRDSAWEPRQEAPALALTSSPIS